MFEKLKHAYCIIFHELIRNSSSTVIKFCDSNNISTFRCEFCNRTHKAKCLAEHCLCCGRHCSLVYGCNCNKCLTEIRLDKVNYFIRTETDTYDKLFIMREYTYLVTRYGFTTVESVIVKEKYKEIRQVVTKLKIIL